MRRIGALHTLPAEEIKVIHNLPNVEKRRYFVAGYADFDEQALMLFRGDGTSLKVKFSFFTPTANETPDFDHVEIIDFGQTIKLGNYEAATDAVLYDFDPEYRKFCESNRNKDIN